MIEYVKGQLVSTNDTGIVIEAAGLGLAVRVHDPDRFHDLVGSSITLPAWLDIQARGVRLFGFKTREERAQFELLLGIPGVGAGTALKLLPAFASLTAKSGHLPQIPGIGPAMRAKVAKWLAKRGGAAVAVEPVEAELRAVLEGLGLSSAEAKVRAAKVAANAGGADLETLVRMAVKH